MSEDQSTKDPLIGQVLAGRYVVVRHLGRGGMGSVYEGKHNVIGKRVAIKVLHAQFAVKAAMVKRFVNEARAAAMLGHPNIIDAIDVGTTGNSEPFLVLEFLEGHDLKQLLKEHGALPVARAVRIIRQVCAGLAAAHDKGIVHRDIKPDNVFLVTQNGDPDHVKLLDFGISKFTQDDGPAMTKVGSTLGTPAYMAPEQLLDASKADARADVYATGVMLFEVLAGMVPFTGASFGDLARKVLTEAPPALSMLRPDLPPGLIAVVERAMARDVTARYQTMPELSAALEPFAQHRESSGGGLTIRDALQNTRDAHDGSTGAGDFRGSKQVEGTANTMPATASSPSSDSVPSVPSAKATLQQGTPLAKGHVAVPRRCPSCEQSLGNEVVCPYCGADLPDPRLGQIIAERYRVEKLVGAGGMGRVYVGTHLTLGEPVAIKFLLAEWTSRGEFRARFRREAMTLAKLRHPGIVPVHDYGEHQDELYMVMEFVRGQPLRDAVPRGETLPVARALSIASELLDVVEFAHAQGVVHRDLKPENVMMLALGDKSDRLKVLDFGLALATDTAANERLTAANAIQGTPAYMSPEQCRGRDVGPPTDVYAVGIILYELLCGDVPFQGATLSDTLVQQMFVAPTRVSERGTRPQVPESVEVLLQSVLAKNPPERPTAAQMRQQIELIRRGEDATTLADRANKARTIEALSSREQRAVAPAASPAPASASTPTNASVALWGISPALQQQLVSAFAVGGSVAVEWRGDELPMPVLEGRPLKAILLPWNADGQRRLKSVRANPAFAKLPVIIVEASEVDDVPALIRAGASDVAYAGTAPDGVVKQAAKLMRRVK